MGKQCLTPIVSMMVALLLVGCDAARPQSQPQKRGGADPRLLALQLEEAYRSSSQEALSAFFQHWHDSVQATNPEGMQDPYERKLCALFRDLLHPSRMDDIVGDSNFGSVSELREGTKYVVIQNTIQYQIGGDASSEKITINDFRPAVNVGDRQVLYLTESYRVALESFLEAGKPPNTVDVDEEVKRLQFLKEYIRVHPGHWSGWDLLTPPSVDLVELDETCEEAAVHFTIISAGGMTIMKRTADGWKIVKSGMLWLTSSRRTSTQTTCRVPEEKETCELYGLAYLPLCY